MKNLGARLLFSSVDLLIAATITKMITHLNEKLITPGKALK
jgi:hypothetical protein